MRYLPKTILVSFVSFALLVALPKVASAAKIYLNPESGNYATNFSVDVMLNPETDKIDAIDVVLTYDPTRIDIQEITNGDMEQYLKKSFNKATGKVEISALNATKPIEATAKIAKIAFIPLVSGIAKVDFVYNPGSVDDTNALEKGIESLTSVAGANYTITLPGVATVPVAPTTPTLPVAVTNPSAPVPSTGVTDHLMLVYLLCSLASISLGFALVKNRAV